MKNIFTTIYITLLILTGYTAGAQAQTVKITGSVQDKQGKAVEFATISLLRAADSTVVKGALTNDKGLYAFDNVAKGNYIAKATSVGYVAGISKAFNVDGAAATISVPAIAMAETQRTLNTVN